MNVAFHLNSAKQTTSQLHSYSYTVTQQQNKQITKKHSTQKFQKELQHLSQETTKLILYCVRADEVKTEMRRSDQ